MAPPSPLHVATQAVRRLVNDEKYYVQELTSQAERIKKLEAAVADGTCADSDGQYVLKQERQALEETKAVFQPLKKRMARAVLKLEEQIASEDAASGNAAELSAAKEALVFAQQSAAS